MKSILAILFYLLPFITIAQWSASNIKGTFLYSASFLNKDTFLVSNDGKLFITQNGGQTFDSLQTFPQQAAFNIVYKSIDSLYAARENSKGLLYSYDGGSSWSAKTFLLPSGDTAFQKGRVVFFGFFDTNNGIIFGDTVKGDIQLFLTQDGGLNWIFQPNPLQSRSIFTSLAFRAYAFKNKQLFSDGKGKILVGNGKLLTLEDYGRKWTFDTSSRAYQSVAFKDNNNGLATISINGVGNKLFKTMDGGESWIQLTDSPKVSTGNLLYVKSTQNKSGFYMSSTSSSLTRTMVSYNEGNTWQQFDTLNHSNGYVFFRDAETGVCAVSSFNPQPIYYYKLKNVGLNDLITKNQHTLFCYPNPANSIVFFNQSFSNIQLFDFQGKLLTEVQNENYLDIKGIPSGLYLIKAMDKNHSISSQKLIILNN